MIEYTDWLLERYDTANDLAKGDYDPSFDDEDDCYEDYFFNQSEYAELVDHLGYTGKEF